MGKYIILGFALATAIGLAGEVYGQSGRVAGVVIDAETRESLIGANVLLTPGERGAITDASGNFEIDALPVGSYVLRVSYIGYQTRSLPDVVVRPNRTTHAEVELEPTVIEAEALVVTAGFFVEDDEQPTSTATFGAEEIRRAAGAGGDLSRIISGLPSLARMDDMRNSLVVRGGSPMENGFYVENISIPNINHFPTQGSSGGPIGLINVDLIRDVAFSAGGFSAAYGNRLSSIMNLEFREGNREETDVQLDLNFAGAGAVGEGGLAGGKGSWLFSARRSYLDFLIGTVFKDEAGAALPVYSDYQGKLVYDVNDRHRITVLDIMGVDRSDISEADARKENEQYFGSWKNAENTAGVNWRYLWRGPGVSQTSVSHSFTRYDLATSRVSTGNQFYRNRSLEQHLRLRNSSYYRWSAAHRLEFGAEAEFERTDYDHRYAAEVDPLGQSTPALEVDETIDAARLGAFASYRWQPAWFLAITTGLRFDHFTYTSRSQASPRIGLRLNLNARTSVNFAAGRYRQSLPLVLLSQNEANRDLAEPRADHLVLGVRRLLTDDTRLTIEAYSKVYRHFPIDPAQPSLFVVDQLFYDQGVYLNHSELVDTGRALTRGVEVMVQKKLANKVYGLVSGAYFRSRYRGGEGVWRDRVFDNRFIVSLEGGFKPNAKHEASLKWTYAGGRPYTPFDAPASEALGRGVFDEARVNADRLPAYHSLSLRYDRRFYFRRTNLVAFISVWNVYGRRNVASYIWNESENRQNTIAQWGTLPIFGLELEL